MSHTSGTPAPFYVRLRNAVTSWPLKRWVSLIWIGLAGFFIGAVPMSFMMNLDPRPDGALAVLTVIAGVGTLLFLLSFAVSFVLSHVVFFRRGRTHVNRVMSRNVLITGYLIALFIAGMNGMNEDAPAYLQALTPAVYIIGLGVLGWMTLLMLGILPDTSRRATPEQLDFYDSLPHADDYIQQHSGSGRPACYHCNSTTIHQFGLATRNDERRVFKCMTCDTWLYRSLQR